MVTWVGGEDRRLPWLSRRRSSPGDLLADVWLFYTELLARLCSLATPFPSLIGRLCSQCEEALLACPEPVLVPKCSYLQQPGGALQHTLTGLCAGQAVTPPPASRWPVM